MKETLQHGKTPITPQLPNFIEQWLSYSAPELRSNAVALEKIQQYFFSSQDEAVQLEQEIEELLTTFYAKAVEMNRLMFMATMQGMRDLANDYNATDVWELDRKLMKQQQEKINKMKNLLDKIDTRTAKSEVPKTILKNRNPGRRINQSKQGKEVPYRSEGDAKFTSSLDQPKTAQKKLV